jgi:hypothetical protein
VAEDFAQHLILHSDIGLTADMIPELRLDHAERALDVGALMVVLQELLAVKGEIMKHLFPQPASGPAMDALEGNRVHHDLGYTVPFTKGGTAHATISRSPRPYHRGLGFDELDRGGVYGLGTPL